MGDSFSSPQSEFAAGTDFPEELRLDISDADLLGIIKGREREATELNESLRKINEENEKYWGGNQLTGKSIVAWKSDIVQNHTFTATETVVPIVVSENPEIAVFPAQETDESKGLADKLQKMHRFQWERLDMGEKMGVYSRHLVIYRFAVLKYFWDYLKNDIGTVVVNPKQIRIDPAATNPDDARYLFHDFEKDVNELKRVYPDKAEEIGRGAKPSLTERVLFRKEVRSICTVTEFWTPEFVVTYTGNTILSKMKNPLYDWAGEGPKEEGTGMGEGTSPTEKVFYNFWDSPRMPFVIRSVFTLGQQLAGETTLLEQARPIQDAINDRKRQIATNAKITANPWTLIDADVMSQEEADRITNEPGLKIVAAGAADPGKLRREAGTPLPAFVMEDLIHSQSAFDNLFGVHSTTRGERGAQETATGRAILRQADLGRIELIVRVMESAITELARGWTQMMRVLYTEEHSAKILGREGGFEYHTFSRDDIEDGVEVMVKSGSLLPVDKVTFRNEAIELWKINAIDPVTFFERLNFPNPKESAERLVLWRQNLIEGMEAPGAAPLGQSPTGGLEAQLPREVTEQLAQAAGMV